MDTLEFWVVLAMIGSAHLLLVAGFVAHIGRTVLMLRAAERSYRRRLSQWSGRVEV